MTRAAEILDLFRTREEYIGSLSNEEYEEPEFEELDYEEPEYDEIGEAAPVRVKRVSGAGRATVRLKCPPGSKLQGRRCVRMSATQRKTLSIAAKRRARKLRGRRGIIARKRAKSMAKRRRLGL